MPIIERRRRSKVLVSSLAPVEFTESNLEHEKRHSAFTYVIK